MLEFSITDEIAQVNAMLGTSRCGNTLSSKIAEISDSKGYRAKLLKLTRSHSPNIAQISNSDWIKLKPLNLALVFYRAMLTMSRYAIA
ncbi:MAG: hypothetical protein F6K55_08140 [Moorea sp. SIO4A3]|nr:hypothetical protein [Moorena sp. SIO4A3]